MSELLYPPYLQWEVCSECNHRCIHCYNYWRADDIPVDECPSFDAISTKIVERKPLYVAITGGEPLLVFEKVKFCIDKFVNAGIMVSISTNGTLLNEEIIKYLKMYNVDLVISFPSVDKEICDAVTYGNDVVGKLSCVWSLLHKYDVRTTLNIVINKLNISSLYDTLKYVAKLNFDARVGVAQRPINASAEYLKYELNKEDFNFIVKTCVKAKHDFNISIDFSVCMPDCAFSSAQDLQEIGKGDCFGGILAYAICTNGDVKACQCDTMVYGNILRDDFTEVYRKMSDWRDGSLIPEACLQCQRIQTCRGGCRVESYANRNDYRGLPSFADVSNMPELIDEDALNDFSVETRFKLNDKAVFLKDLCSYRVSVGIVPTYLTFEFAEWLMHKRMFKVEELCKDCEIEMQEINVILNLLVKNNVLQILQTN